MRTHARPSLAGVFATTLAAIVLLLVPASPAAAHNTLKSAAPAKNARLATAPTEITLEFMQKLDPAFTTIALSDATQRRVPTGEPIVTGAKGAVTIGEPLTNGSYTVAYRVVSTDGHPVQGSYQFTVADPTASPQPTAAATGVPATAPSAASASPAAAPRDGGNGPWTLALAGVGILVVTVVVAGVAVLVRRSRTAS